MKNIVFVGAALAFTMVAACSDEAAGPDYEALTENEATAQAGIDLVTTGSLRVSASCPTINCPNGTPGATMLVPLTRANITVTPAGPRSFSFTAQISGATTQDIPVNLSGNQCGLDIDTSAGSSPNITFAGTATFVTPSPGGPNRLDVMVEASGFENQDVTVTGNTTCQAFNASVGLLIGTFEDYLSGTLHFCGATGPALLVECPVTAALGSSKL